MHKSHDFFTDLPVDTDKKIKHLYDLVNVKNDVDISYEMLEMVTEGVMNTRENSDVLFLHWLHYVGHYIKTKYGGKWYLRTSNLLGATSYSPLIVNDDGRAWKVGDFCWKTYYKNGKLRESSFEFFHKLYIEQLARKSKVSQLNFATIQPLE